MKYIPCIFCFLALVIMGSAPLRAAPAKNASSKSQAPIAIDADSLEVIQSQNKAIFKGNVVAKQADMTLRSAVMTVFYGTKKQGTESALGSLTRIEVEGNVSLVTATESATGEHGVYDAVKNKVFLSDNVVLKRAGNVLNGSALEYNVNTGSSMLSGGASGKAPQTSTVPAKTRVRGLFVPEGKE